MKIVVTTGRDVDGVHEERAARLAARFSVPLVPRGNLQKMGEDADCFYVVRRACEELRHKDGRSAHVQPGMMPTKLQQGPQHPFIRAVRGAFDGGGDDGEDVESIVDATLGLANDAVHLAALTGARVRGIEKSPWLFALLEEGLPRIAKSDEAWADAAARVSAECGDSADVLAAADDDSADVVVIDPMMSRARKNAPSFDLLRDFAEMSRASPQLLREAWRVCRRRVVLKLGKGAPLPINRSIEFPRHVDGAHVAYWVHEKGADPLFVDDDVATSGP